jgi:S-disulfanyl-L-cysteine oxidoreductase SoxD
MDDFRKILYGVVIGFIAIIVGWVSFLTYSGCGFSLDNCNASVPKIERTSIPSLVPATLPAPVRYLASTATATATSAITATAAPTETGGEQIARPSNPGGPGAALDLTGDPNSGKQIFAANCRTCHAAEGKGGNPNPGSSDGTIPALNPIDPTIVNADPKVFAYNVDLFIEHGSTPDGPNPIISMLAWGDKKLLTPQQIADVIAYIISLNPVPASTSETPAAPSSSATATLMAASPAATSAVTSTAAAGSSSGVPRPSNPGGPGDAINLTGDPNSGAQIFATNCQTCHAAEGKGGNPNPGSTAGTIPALNLINPLLKSSDHMTFVTNLDLFVQHGSTPAGPGPTYSMPPWGDSGKMTQQQIADVIAYVISLNP